MNDHPIVKSVHGQLKATGLPQPIPSERSDVEGPIKDAAKAAKMNIPVNQLPLQGGAPPGFIARYSDTAGPVRTPLDSSGRCLNLTKLRQAWGSEYETIMRKAVEQFVRKGTLETVEQMIAGTGVDTDTLVLISRLGGKSRAKKPSKAVDALYGDQPADSRDTGLLAQDGVRDDDESAGGQDAKVSRGPARDGVEDGKRHIERAAIRHAGVRADNAVHSNIPGVQGHAGGMGGKAGKEEQGGVDVENTGDHTGGRGRAVDAHGDSRSGSVRDNSVDSDNLEKET